MRPVPFPHQQQALNGTPRQPRPSGKRACKFGGTGNKYTASVRSEPFKLGTCRAMVWRVHLQRDQAIGGKLPHLTARLQQGKIYACQ